MFDYLNKLRVYTIWNCCMSSKISQNLTPYHLLHHRTELNRSSDGVNDTSSFSENSQDK
jgi:hypothetical protein